MKVRPIKIKIKQPTQSVADKLYAKHQAIRKEKGLPDASEYKKKLNGMKTEQLENKGRFVSGPPKKPIKSPTIVSPMKEAKDVREYDYEGDMAVSQLRAMIFNAEDLIDMMDDDTNLPEWVQSKITLAEDYISTAANYLRGELSEAANPAQQAAIAINMKKKGIKPKNEEVELSGTPDWYKKKYGLKEEADEPSMAARTLSRKAQIVKMAAKSKKEEREEATDKFQKDPELSSDIQKT